MRIAYSARAKPLELKGSAHPSVFPGAPWYLFIYFNYFSGALQLALAGKLGRIAVVEGNLSLLHCVLPLVRHGQSCVMLSLIHVCQE